MKAIGNNQKARRILVLLAILGFASPVIVPAKEMFSIVLAHFHTIITQTAVCLLLLSYAVSVKKLRLFTDVRQESGKIYWQLLIFNFTACLLYYLCEIASCYLMGGRILSQRELFLTIVLVLMKFLILLLTATLFAYSYLVEKSWPVLAIGIVAPILYHYFVEFAIFGRILTPYLRY